MTTTICNAMIEGSMSPLLEMAVDTKIKKTDDLAENGILSVFDRTEHALSHLIYCTKKDHSSIDVFSYNVKCLQELKTAKRTMLLNRELHLSLL